MIKKTVTPRKVAANRNNAKRSTGPRTEWGKFNSRFNAVKDGLFAVEVVVPDCDGDDARRKFSELLQNLQQEFEPVGAFQTALVEKIAEGLWRLRRATRAEYGATRVGGLWDRSHDPPEGSFIDKLNRSVDLERLCIKALTEAREEIRRTGKLSKESYQKIRLLVEDQHCDRGDNTNTETTSEPVIDDDFVQRVEKKTESLRSAVQQVDLRVAERLTDCIKQGALPPTEDSEKISRCRMRTEKEIDWALRTLFRLQKRGRHKEGRVSYSSNSCNAS
jgi:hypothetical protein